MKPRDSAEWKLGYNARTSAERCNKREKIDYKFRRRQIPLIYDVVLPPVFHHDVSTS